MGGVVKSIVHAVGGMFGNDTADASGAQAQADAIKQAADQQAAATAAAAQKQKEAADAAAAQQASQAQASAQAAAQSQMQSINQAQIANQQAASQAEDAAKQAQTNTVTVDTTQNAESDDDSLNTRRKYAQGGGKIGPTAGGSGISLS
jgi:hypothetical protein